MVIIIDENFCSALNDVARVYNEPGCGAYLIPIITVMVGGDHDTIRGGYGLIQIADTFSL